MKTSLVVVSVFSILLTACGGKGSGIDSATAAVVGAPKPPVDFSPALLSLAVGTYSGTCYTDITLRTPIDTTLTLTPDFVFKTAGVSGSMQGFNINLGASREFDASGPISGFFSAAVGINGNEGISFGLSADALEGSGSANTIDEAKVVCRPLPTAAKLMTSSIYQALAKHLDSVKKEVGCLNGISTYQLQDGVAKIDDQSYSLTTGLKKEIVEIVPDFDKTKGWLTYLSESQDGTKFFLRLDRYGDLSVVNVTSKAGVQTSCGLK